MPSIRRRDPTAKRSSAKVVVDLNLLNDEMALQSEANQSPSSKFESPENVNFDDSPKPTEFQLNLFKGMGKMKFNDPSKTSNEENLNPEQKLEELKE